MSESDTSAVRRLVLRRAEPHRIPVPEGIAPETSEVALSFEPNGGRPRFACVPPVAASSHAVTRTLTRRSGEDTRCLTLPKQCVRAAGLRGCDTLVHRDEDGRLCVGFDRASRLDDVSLAARTESFVSRRRGGELALSLGAAVAGPLAAVETLWFSLDHYAGQHFFVFDAAESRAPPDALPVTTDPNTGRDDTSGLSLLFPRVVGRLCGVGSSTLRVGRTAAGGRLLATTEGE